MKNKGNYIWNKEGKSAVVRMMDFPGRGPEEGEKGTDR